MGADDPERHERMVAAAVHLAHAGYRIGWAPAGDGKAPNRHWQDDATADPALVPGLLGGARNSLVIPAGHAIVIDIDAESVWGDLIEGAGLPDGLRVASPTAGHGHVYGRVSPGTDMSTIPGAFAGGEIRRHDPATGTASMVLGPWSKTSAGTYRTLNRARGVPELPPAVLDYLRASARRQGDARNRARGPEDDGWLVTAGRHDFLVGRARRLRGVGMTGERLVEEIARLDRERCRPSLADTPGRGTAELRAIVAWVSQKIGDDPPPNGGADGSPAGDGETARPKIVFMTAREFCGTDHDAVPWVLDGYLARGAVTELVGKIKSAGKSTFLAAMTRAIVGGEPFLGRPTSQGAVVMLTEMGGSALRRTLVRADLADRTDVLVLPRGRGRGEWREVALAARDAAIGAGGAAVIVDTLGPFAGLSADEENDAPAALAAMAPLLEAAEAGLAVCVVRHERKSGGDIADAGRGSSAFGGAVDVMLRLARSTTLPLPNVRELEALSRFDETPETLTIALGPDGFHVVDDPAGMEAEVLRELLLTRLPVGEPGQRLEPIRQRLPRGLWGLLPAVLEALLADGRVGSAGTGRKGSPRTFWRVPRNPRNTSATPKGDSSRSNSGHPEGETPQPAPGPGIDPAAMWKAIDDAGGILQ